jgi:hypothetical protein
MYTLHTQELFDIYYTRLVFYVKCRFFDVQTLIQIEQKKVNSSFLKTVNNEYNTEISGKISYSSLFSITYGQVLHLYIKYYDPNSLYIDL